MKHGKLLYGLVVCAATAGVAVAEPHEKAHHGESFGYYGMNGPQYWSELSLDYIECGDGHQQSPIDIEPAKALTDGALPELVFDYKDVDAVLINNTHTLEVEYGHGSTATFGEEKYELLQFHFHALSEHRMNGEPSDMEVHLVHKNERGELLVVGIMMNVGEENAFLAKFWDKFGMEASKLDAHVQVNAADILPAKYDYYTYNGSLTTPPCSEIVTWVVMKEPIEVSRAQFDNFVRHVGYNARPTQPAYGRVVSTH